MKKFFIWLISLYQATPLHSHSLCRFYPTCSEYTKIAIKEFGCFKGIFLGIKRILRCNPFGGCGVDYVPTKEEK